MRNRASRRTPLSQRSAWRPPRRRDGRDPAPVADASRPAARASAPAAWNALDRDDLDAELLAGVWEAATAVGPATPGRGRPPPRRSAAAGAGGRSARGRLGGTIRAALTEMEESAVQKPTRSGPHDVLAEAVRAGVISAAEAELFRASRATDPEVAGAHGDLGQRRPEPSPSGQAASPRLARRPRSDPSPVPRPSVLHRKSPPIPPPPPTRNGRIGGLCRGAGVAGRATRRGTGRTNERRWPPPSPPRDPVQAEGRWTPRNEP